MLFGLINACKSFCEMIERIFKNMKICIWYLNNFLICSNNTKVEHQGVVEKVLHQCVEHGLAVNLLKSNFHVPERIFLVHVSNSQEVKIDLSKLKTMAKWLILRNKKEV